MSQDHNSLPPTRGEGQGQTADAGDEMALVLAGLQFDLRRQITFGPDCNQAVKDGLDRLAALSAIRWKAVRLYTRQVVGGFGSHVIVEAERADGSAVEVIRDYADTTDTIIDHWARLPSAAGQSITEASVYGSSPLINEAHPPGGNSHEG